jgi:hypothetical protein
VRAIWCCGEHKRGTFNAMRFLAAMVAIGAETVKLEDI